VFDNRELSRVRLSRGRLSWRGSARRCRRWLANYLRAHLQLGGYRFLVRHGGGRERCRHGKGAGGEDKLWGRGGIMLMEELSALEVGAE